MKFMPAIFFLLMFSFSAAAQHSIKGRVVNVSTGAAIPGCSVFISNTSKGTTSDNAGYFELQDVPGGKHELIVSSIGYETNVFSFSEAQLPLRLRVELTVKVKEIENVTIEPFVEEGWDKWGKTFMDNFIGTTDFSKQCRIKNEKAIKFRYYKKSNRLKAYADEPVIIENKALGYTISYQLEEFEMNFSERSVVFTGYSLFEQMDAKRQSLHDKWINNRGKAYSGSIEHFMRSIYNNKLAEEGFEVRTMTRSYNTEKARVKAIYAASKTSKTINVDGRKIVSFGIDSSRMSKDSLPYYQRIMHQKDYEEEYGKVLLTADSLVVATENEYKIMHFDDYLYVVYKNAVEEDSYLLTQFPARAATFQRSIVFLINGKEIIVEKNGNYYDPKDLFTSAYWGWSEKMANSLPLDYEPGN